MYLLLVFVSQVLINILRVLEIKYTFQHNVPKLLFNTLWINMVWLVSTFMSIDALLKGNFLVVVVFLAGSVLGKYMGMNIDIEKQRKQGFNILELF